MLFLPTPTPFSSERERVNIRAMRGKPQTEEKKENKNKKVFRYIFFPLPLPLLLPSSSFSLPKFVGCGKKGRRRTVGFLWPPLFRLLLSLPTNKQTSFLSFPLLPPPSSPSSPEAHPGVKTRWERRGEEGMSLSHHKSGEEGEERDRRINHLGPKMSFGAVFTKQREA